MAESTKVPVTDVSPYLKQVRIRDYAPLRDAKVDFKPGLNIIIGHNGVGKTRFLNLTSQLITAFEISYVGADCELILGYDQDIAIRFQQPVSIDGTEVEFITYASIAREAKAGLDVIVSYKGKDFNSDTLDLALWDAGINFNLMSEVLLARHGTPLQQLPLVDLPAAMTVQIFNGRMQLEPKIEQTIVAGRPRLVDAIFGLISSLFIRGYIYERRNKTAFVLKVETVRIEIERAIESFLTYLNPIICSYTPILQLRLSNAYQIYDNALQKEILIKGLVLEYLVGESWLPFSALSDGTKRMLYLITQMVMPSAQFVEQQSPISSFNLIVLPRIIFLEEPELGIHPDQLQKLLSLIREVSKEHQVIMTTHSPQVLNMLTTKELDRITICELDPKKGTQFRKLSPAKRAKAKAYMQKDSYLSDVWLYSNLEAE